MYFLTLTEKILQKKLLIRPTNGIQLVLGGQLKLGRP